MEKTTLIELLILYKEWIIFSLCLACVTGIVAKIKNRFVFGWVALGLFFNPIILFFLIELDTVLKTSGNLQGE